MKLVWVRATFAAIALWLLGAWSVGLAQTSPPKTGILTHHVDYYRSGANPNETALTPLSISSSNFGVITTVGGLADSVDAQPLIVPNVQITCVPNQSTVVCQSSASGPHDVAYVMAGNSVYAIDANNGQILLQRDFGAYGPCGRIKSTPVINPATGALLIVIYTSENTQTIMLHSLNVGTLTDKVTPYLISPQNTVHPLTDGSPYSFNPQATCLKSSLALVGGNVYAGFRGNETLVGNTLESGPTRGWLLGWNASTLTPLPSPFLTDLQATSTNSFFLSSIWMSGSGIASDGTNLYFTTGNSDPAGTSYNFPKNVEESVVKVTAPSLKVTSVFTPSNFAALDAADNELGSGGAIVIPIPQASPLVVAGGKDGRMFLLNSASLGGFTPGGPDNVLDMKNIGGCWCEPSFFPGSDGMVRVVSSGGSSVIMWKISAWRERIGAPACPGGDRADHPQHAGPGFLHVDLVRTGTAPTIPESFGPLGARSTARNL